MNALKYRPDIDGLRAVAVLSVILFHAGVPFMTGGFVGVDVFFVLSGYLITALILKDLQAGTFSFAGFWERRARRILPALCVVIAATLVAGWFILLPDDYVALGKQVAAQSAFGSNILFYKQAGYFDTDSFLKPLLHTWSLSVEEQFYLLFPAAIVAVWKFKPRYLLSFLIFSALLSFVLCLIVMGHNPNLAFYMLPLRGWELLLGAILTATPPQYLSAPRAIRETLSALGLAAILAPVFLYSGKTSFPGWAALPPCLGTIAIIWANTQSPTWTGRALSYRPVVFIGLISYAWYLWHWPILVLAKYNPLQTFTPQKAFICLALSFILAVVTWRFVERPIRGRKILPSMRTFYISSACALLVLAGVGAGLMLSGGFAERLDPAVVRYAAGITDVNPWRHACDKTPPKKIAQDDVCETLPETKAAPDFILWGDSQADSIVPLFFDLSRRYGRNGYILTHHGCESVLDFHKSTWEKDFDCNEFNAAVFDLIQRHKIKNVFLVSSYNSWLSSNAMNPAEVTLDGKYPDGYKTALAAGMARTLDRLRDAGAKVYLMIDIPGVQYNSPRILAMEEMKDPVKKPSLGISTKSYTGSRKAQIEPFLDQYGRSKIAVLDPLPVLCPDRNCLAEHDGYPLYYNNSHLSAHGALFLAPLYEPYFKKGF